MTESRSEERRKHPRRQVRVPVNVRSGEAGQGGFSTNVSRSGICCLMAEPIPLFTRVSVALRAPQRSSGAGGTRELECEGIVVRQEEVETAEGDLFETAIFFQDPPEKIREFLTNHASPEVV
jgi:hypothetical protein